MKKRNGSLLCCILAAFALCGPLSARAAESPAVTCTAARDGQTIAVTMRVQNTALNVLQFALRYDTERMEPAQPDGSPANTARQMTAFLAPEYARGRGWLAGTATGTLEDGVVSYTLYAHEQSKGVPEGSDADGYVDMGEQGTSLLTLYFKQKDGAALYADSLALAATTGCPTGILLSTKNADDALTPIEVNAPQIVTIDLSAVAEPGKTPGKEPGGGSGSTSGGSGGGNREEKPAPPTAEPGALTLSDIAGHWAEGEIRTLVEAGAVSGDPDGAFRPDDVLTRGEFAKVLAGVLKLEQADAKAVFADCAGHWAAPYIGAVYHAGYVKGTGENAFSPDAPLTREALVTILARVHPATPERTASFTDRAQIAAWAAEAVDAAVQQGLVAGYPDGSFRPQAPVTRAEMAKILCAML